MAAVNARIDAAEKVAANDASKSQALVNEINVGLTQISLSANTLAENITVGEGYVVGVLSVNDPDGNGNPGLAWSLSGVDANQFAIENGNLVYTGASPNFEDKSSYSVQVTSTDASLAKSQAFIVNVLNIDEAGTIGSITGTATQGQTLTAGTVSDPDGTVSGISYQWKANGNNITGATSSTYTLTQAEVGKAITVVATYTDPLGSGKTVTSAATSEVMQTADLNPRLSTNLSDSVTNLDVTSNLVFTSDKALSFGSGSITITDLGGKTAGGFRGDVNTNTQTIDLNSPAGQALISFSADKKTVTINPKWDLDLSSNYRISIGKGAFVSGDGASEQLDVDFGTVTPGIHSTGTVATEAVLARKMLDNGTMADSKYWFDFEQIGLISPIIQLGDLSGKDYVLVAKNYQTTAPDLDVYDDGLNTAPFQVGFTNFGNGDTIYFDNQLNNAVQQFVPDNVVPQNAAASVIGANDDQTILQFSKSSLFPNGSSLPNVALSFEKNIQKTLFDAIYTYDFQGATYLGFADTLLNNPTAVIAG